VKKIYAVVDLETTAPNKKGGRIIQIGIVLVQSGKVLSKFASDVNPGKTIPSSIEALTGISNKRVNCAPFFEELALTIVSILSETVFVAHNVNFDFKFLNAELARIGLPKLNNMTVDTVELTKIFFPELTSFRLACLAEKFDLIHDNPHQADSDAIVTAQLFFKIQEKMNSIPDITMEQLASLSSTLIADNSLFIKDYSQNRKQRVGIDERQTIVNGLVLRKQEEFEQEILVDKPKFPLTKKRKSTLFKKNFEFSKEQARYQNLVYRFFANQNQEQERNLFVEAPENLEKTFCYLLPLSFLASYKKPAIVSSSKSSQKQIACEVAKVNATSALALNATFVKEPRYLIDLEAFLRTLNSPCGEQAQFSIYQMMILVWLLTTETGYLDELTQRNDARLFFESVSHHTYVCRKNSPFYEVDFVRLQNKRVENSNLLLVNHDFLVYELKSQDRILPNEVPLILDDAHCFPKILKKSNTTSVNPAKILRLLDKIVLEVSGNSKKILSMKRILQEIATTIVQILNIFRNLRVNSLESVSLPSDLIISEQNILKIHLRDLQKFFAKLPISFSKYLDLQKIIYYLKDFILICDNSESEEVYYSKILYWTMAQSYPIFQRTDFRFAQQMNQLQEIFGKVFFTSETLVAGNNREYLPKTLQVTGYQVKVLKSPSSNDLQMYLPQEFLEDDTACQNPLHIAHFLKNLACAHPKRRILVLFADLEVLTQVYSKLHGRFPKNARTLLAQTVSGGKDKILRNFLGKKDAILLGTKLFLEELEFPKNSLNLLVIVKLPFDCPQTPQVIDYSKYLKTQNRVAFRDYYLPKAIIVLRKAIVLLAKSKNKHSAIFLLDGRVKNKNYAQSFSQILDSLKIVKMKEAIARSQEFFL